MKANKDNRIQYYAAAYIATNTENLLKCLDAITKRDDIEDIHDLRVASRRIRTALTIFSSSFSKKREKQWQDAVRSVTQKFGKTRDLDVQIDFLESLLSDIQVRRIRSGLLRIHLRLIQQRRKINLKIDKHTEAFLKDKDILEMHKTMQDFLLAGEPSEFPPELYQLAFNTIHSALDQFLYYEVFLHHPDKVHELHLMRIAAKQLRYTLEVFLNIYHGKMEPFLEIMRSIQQQLGQIRDCDVWLAFIPAFTQKEKQRTLNYYGNSSAMKRYQPGFEYLQQNREDERKKLYAHFMADWQIWRKQEVWLKLRELILQATITDNLDTQPDSASVGKPFPDQN